MVYIFVSNNIWRIIQLRTLNTAEGLFDNNDTLWSDNLYIFLNGSLRSVYFCSVYSMQWISDINICWFLSKEMVKTHGLM